MSLQDWSPLSTDVVFSRDTFHCNLRKTDVFPLTPGASKWNKEKPETAKKKTKDVTGYNKKGFYNPELLHTWLFKVCAHCSGQEHYNHAKR